MASNVLACGPVSVSAEGSGETTNVSDLRRVFLTTGERCNNGQAWRSIQDNGKLGSGKHWTLSFGCCNQKLLKTDDRLCARGFLAVRVQVHLKSG